MKSRRRTTSSSVRSRTRVAGSTREPSQVSLARVAPTPYMYVRATSSRLSRGRSTPPIRAIGVLLSLSLLVPRVGADDQDAAPPANDLALVADRLDARLHLHRSTSPIPIDDPSPSEVIGGQLR